MKLSILASLATLLAVGAAISQPQRQVIVSYPDNTPDSVLEAAKNEIKAAGGFITHEYKIFKCVSVIAHSCCAMSALRPLLTRYQGIRREDNREGSRNRQDPWRILQSFGRGGPGVLYPKGGTTVNEESQYTYIRIVGLWLNDIMKGVLVLTINTNLV